MAYVKTNWVNGQTPINATNLNKIEQGIEDATITPKTTKTTSDSDVYACNYVNDALIEEYSTDEVMTNKVWIDGKPIWKKVLTGTINSTSYIVMTGINTLNLINASGWMALSSSVQQVIPSYADNINYSGICVVNNDLKLYTPSAWDGASYKIIVEYTRISE